LTAIANAGRGKAEFIVRDEQIKEIIVRQFARVSSANLFHIQLNNNGHRVIDKIEKTQTLFNHEFYDLLLETDAVTDDFELVCETGNKRYSFVIQKDTLEQPILPLDKIYAAEQIRRAEKYIEARPYNENKGYKEQIVEIAVLYQIDSKYTAFIAVNERDEKLTDIPELQNTVLESPSGWNMKSEHNYCCLSLCPETVAMFLDKKKIEQKCSINQQLKLTPLEKPVFRKDEIAELFALIKHCEEYFADNEEHKANTLFKIILSKLQIHFLSPSDKYKKLFEQMRNETPLVYKRIEKYLKQTVKK
jgi:hypothetical protein